MASRGKKTERDVAVDALNNIARERPHPDVLWSNILSADDSIALERMANEDGILTLGALSRAMLQQRQVNLTITPIPDAALTLMIAATVEQALELAISAYFVLDDDGCQRMFDDNAHGPISNFSAKIKVGYALGIYPREAKDELDMIRLIRNAFAHSKEELSFKSKIISDGCRCLLLPHRIAPALSKPSKTAKVNFLDSCRTLYRYLEWLNNREPVKFKDHPLYPKLFFQLPDEISHQ